MAKDRGRERRSPSPPSKHGVRFSRDGLSIWLLLHRDWRTDRWISDIVNSPRSAKKSTSLFDRGRAIDTSNHAISLLRQRMIDDMRMRILSPKT